MNARRPPDARRPTPRPLLACSLGLATLVLSLGSTAGIASARVDTDATHCGPPTFSEPASTGRFQRLTLACAFASATDQVTVYARSHGFPETARWQDAVTFRDEVWIFDANATGRASLIIDFRQDGSALVANLFDDQDGDAAVSYEMHGGVPAVTESTQPTVRVSAADGWWTHDGIPNLNLHILARGLLKADFQPADFTSEAWYRKEMGRPGRWDFDIRVRDTNADGRPDHQITLGPPYFASQGTYKSQLMVNEGHNESPLTGGLFWPYLGRQTYGVVKPYGASPPPIQVDWSRARLSAIGEFVASRGNAQNWFVYSTARFGPGIGDYANFENPFAFYDLAAKNDGYPDLQIRNEYAGPGDSTNPQGLAQPTSNIRYSWDQDHDHSWDFKVDLLGRHPINERVDFADFSVRTVPYREFPRWVTSKPWDAATFVALEGSSYWTSEGIYEGTTAGFLGAYVDGGDLSAAGNGALDSLPEGMRGEYRAARADQPFLYFSPIDHKLHLLNAQAGVWRVSASRELRYENLGGAHIDRWVLREAGEEKASLTLAADQLILAEPGGIRIKTVGMAPAAFTTLPPTSPDEWASLGRLLQQHRVQFPGDDLRAMFEQFPGSAHVMSGAALRSFRLTEEGFRAVIELPEQTPALPWAAGLGPGSAVVHYQLGHGYSAQPLGPVQLHVEHLQVLGDYNTALSPLEVKGRVRNRGNADAQAVPLTLDAKLDGEYVKPLGTIQLDVPSGETGQFTFTWTPPIGGDWSIQATGQGVTPGALHLWVDEAPVADLPGLLGAQGMLDLAVASAGVLLAGIAALAASVAFLVWRVPARSDSRSAS
jgi:hypothetical protein